MGGTYQARMQWPDTREHELLPYSQRRRIMAKLDDKAMALLSQPNFGYFAEIMEDGSPHVSPVWVDVSDGYILVNTAIGRVKERNVRRDPRVALSVGDKDNQYDKVDIRGRVVEIIEGEEADRSIDSLAKKYLGEDVYPFRKPGEQRIILRIEPTTVSHAA
jgi:PPOX class probable F420-dependent enzyme